MKNRLEETEDINVINKKEDLYRKIKKDYKEYRIEGKIYKGTLERIDDEKFLFLGIDQKLLSYKGFYKFQEYHSDFEYYLNDNDFFYVYRDGICVGEILKDDLQEDSDIPHYQKRTRISDIDDMNVISFEKYIEFLFIENGYDVIKIKSNTDIGYDFDVLKNNKSYKVEIKHFSLNSRTNKLNKYNNLIADIIITNGTLEQSFESNNVIVIDRTHLKEICKNNLLLERNIKK